MDTPVPLKDLFSALYILRVQQPGLAARHGEGVEPGGDDEEGDGGDGAAAD